MTPRPPRPLVSRDDAGAVLPGALHALADLRERGLTHRWVRHVRSSQAFALNLFAPLPTAGVRLTLAHLGLDVVDTEPVVFEFEDEQDRLAEASPRSRHRTQVDVVLRGTTANGRHVAALIEVKLSEWDFGSCSAFDSARNPRRDVCHSPGLFGGDPDACFQLNNHGHGRRHYDAHLPEPTLPSVASEEGCLVRDGRNQPMRNLALTHLLADQGEIDQGVYALCAPLAHSPIWRRFGEFREVFPDTARVQTAALPAELVARAHADGGAAFVDRYAPALTDRALLHMSSDGSQLLGVWLSRYGQLESYYTDDEFAPLAEERLTYRDWLAALEDLPKSSPYVVWWEATECSFSESAADVHARLVQHISTPAVP